MNFFIFGARERVKKDHYLIRLDKLVNWGPMADLLRGLHVNEIHSRGGPKAYNNLSMFKALLLGQWHSLSDPALEDALRLRLDFIRRTRENSRPSDKIVAKRRFRRNLCTTQYLWKNDSF